MRESRLITGALLGAIEKASRMVTVVGSMGIGGPQLGEEIAE